VDVDGDRPLDLVVANDGGASVSVLRGNGDGRFAAKDDFAAAAGSRHVIAERLDSDRPPGSRRRQLLLRSLSVLPNESAFRPYAETGSATKLNPTHATLTAVVNPNGQATSAYFEYGTTTSYGSRSKAVAIGSRTSDVPLPTRITKLETWPGLPVPRCSEPIAVGRASAPTQGVN
jgi:hypothetical protein